MIEDNKGLEISKLLRDWYQSHKRDLPWRKSTDPYVIWISEIILQQTRVSQGMEYFLRFMERFPNVSSLAMAEEDEVLRYWQGLGYYSRARNLHTAAKDIMTRFGGTFPRQYKDILSLKGIGEYTAAAIISFAWNEPFPVVDGNVFRVLSRLYAITTPIDIPKGKKEFMELAGVIMDHKYAGIHNQAMMEFGALQCVPSNPHCLTCPIHIYCMAYASGDVSAYPVKQHKTKTHNRYFHYFYIKCKGKTWLSRRNGQDIWKGLYEFPLIETNCSMDFVELQQKEPFKQLFKGIKDVQMSIDLINVKHILSHQILYATFYQVEIEQENESLQAYLSIPIEDIDNYAMPRLIHIYLEKMRGYLFE